MINLSKFEIYEIALIYHKCNTSHQDVCEHGVGSIKIEP
ncbi:hypothetical protein LCGC14_0677080 [marine sediment metagenome]|uniref:Uncharacterized protein n=1 Tax=marine sediment metagenome TaxID=412755 RepID=A0A0F9QU98_9ZZZZ